MEQDSMSNIWNSNCIMQARRTAGRRWGDGSVLDLFNCQFYDIKVGRKNEKMGEVSVLSRFQRTKCSLCLDVHVQSGSQLWVRV